MYGRKGKNRKCPEIPASPVGRGLPEWTSLNFRDLPHTSKCMGEREKWKVTGNPGQSSRRGVFPRETSLNFRDLTSPIHSKCMGEREKQKVPGNLGNPHPFPT